MFLEGIDLSIFIVNEISTYILEEKSREQREPDLELEEDTIFLDDGENNRKDSIVENNEDKGEFHAIIWEFYIKDKEELIKIKISASIMHLKEGNTIWTCVKDNITKEKQEYKAIGLCVFNYK